MYTNTAQLKLDKRFGGNVNGEATSCFRTKTPQMAPHWFNLVFQLNNTPNDANKMGNIF